MTRRVDDRARGGLTTRSPLRYSALGAALLVALVSWPARAQEMEKREARRLPDQTWGDIFSGPFDSPRIFTMPTADVVGAYQFSASGDASLLTETGVLSTTSLYAIGFGDIAQLEYRSEAASTALDPVPLELFTVGVQFEVPLPESRGWPGLGLALRLGLPEEHETPDGRRFDQAVSDVYIVTSLPLWGVMEPVTLHAGTRIAQATITPLDTEADELRDYLALPTVGVEFRMNEKATIAGEFLFAPHFDPTTSLSTEAIGSRSSARLGLRWAFVGPLILDTSIGYRIRGAKEASDVNNLVGWDMRAGVEAFLPWGAMLCRTVEIFCE